MLMEHTMFSGLKGYTAEAWQAVCQEMLGGNREVRQEQVACGMETWFQTNKTKKTKQNKTKNPNSSVKKLRFQGSAEFPVQSGHTPPSRISTPTSHRNQNFMEK